MFKEGHVQKIELKRGYECSIIIKCNCFPEMRKDRVYKIIIMWIHRRSGEIQFAKCGCVAGKGPRACCKLIASALYRQVNVTIRRNVNPSPNPKNLWWHSTWHLKGICFLPRWYRDTQSLRHHIEELLISLLGLGVVGLDQTNMLGISLGPNRLGLPLKCALQTRVHSLTGMLSHRIRCIHIFSNFGFFSGKR